MRTGIHSLAFQRRDDQKRRLRKVTSMARKPNYDFEKRERERLKQIKNAARAEEKLKGNTTAPEAAPQSPADKDE